jgi:glucose/arabinose dehydrogenase
MIRPIWLKHSSAAIAVTGELWQTDNALRGGGEINISKPCLNYGWPVVTYGRAYTTDSDSISGMAFYTANKFPEWKRPTCGTEQS